MYAKYGMDYRKISRPFFRGQIMANDGSAIVWFASEDINISVRNKELHLHMDGTFDVVPGMAEQFFIISAQIQDMVIFHNK